MTRAPTIIAHNLFKTQLPTIEPINDFWSVVNGPDSSGVSSSDKNIFKAGENLHIVLKQISGKKIRRRKYLIC